MFKKVIYNLQYNSDDVWFIKISLHNIYIYIQYVYNFIKCFLQNNIKLKYYII